MMQQASDGGEFGGGEFGPPRRGGVRTVLLAGTAAAGLVLQAAAQEQSTPQAGATHSKAIEEVVVTARKRPERVQTSP